MPISLSQEIPEIFDPTNPESMRQWMVAVKQCIEEITQKGQQRQLEIRSSAPSTADLNEGELVAYVNGATIRIYTKQNAVIRYWNLT